MKNLFEETTDFLRKNGVDSPRLEARMIFGAVLDLDYAQISGREIFSENQEKKIREYAKQRAKNKPLDKILGKKFFYKNEFMVDENVLSPRPDTEILVEKAIDLIKKHKLKRVLDMGTGSGCIICSIISDCGGICGVGIDISPQALKVAKKNGKRLNLQNLIKFEQKSWKDEDFKECFAEKFDIIVSNPPYIPLSDEETLMPEVKKYDPKIALFGGDDGLDEYKNIAKVVPYILQENGYLLLEVGINQAEQVKNIFNAAGFLFVEKAKDLAGIDRCLIFKK